jgi:hypothetical protein
LLFVLLVSVGCEPAADGTPLGAACASDAQCDGLRCMAATTEEISDLADQPLACGMPDTQADEPGDACEAGDDCALGLCLLAGACARPCADEDDCDERERCQAVFVRSGGDALTQMTACVASVSLPDDVDVEQTLQRAAIEDGEGELELPGVERDATTFFVLEHTDPSWPNSDCRPPLCVRELRAADTLLFRADACEPEPEAIVAVATGEHIDPVVIRLAGQAAALGADGYALRVAGDRPGDVRVTRISSRRQGERLDLNLYYVGARELSPQGERGPALIEGALDVVDGIFAQAGISIGEVRQIEVPGALPERGVAFEPAGDQAQGFATLAVRFGVWVELPHLFRLSAGANNAAIDVFFVSEIKPRDDSGEPEAQAGGVPGPLGMHGTGGSGIAISTDMMAGDPEALGRTLAHELAHFMGLFHTSEADGCVRDVLADTPACTLDQDADSDGQLTTADCADHGADNLMFWAKTTGTALTADQIGVLRSAPVLH